MVAKLRRKTPLYPQDVNANSAKRMCLKNNILLEDLNKENIPFEPNVAWEGPESSGSNLTGFLNEHLERKLAEKDLVTRPKSQGQECLTASSLGNLQSTLKDFETKLCIQNRDCFIKDAHYSDDNLTQCRINLLFELESLPNLSWVQKGNLRTAKYIPSVYQSLDPDWYLNPAFSIDDFSNLPEEAKLYNVLSPLLEESTLSEEQKSEPEAPDNAKVEIENIGPSSYVIPSSKLKFRGKSTAFNEDIEYQSLLKVKVLENDNDDDVGEREEDENDNYDQISLPDSLDHCKSIKKRFTNTRKRLNKNSIMFHKK